MMPHLSRAIRSVRRQQALCSGVALGTGALFLLAALVLVDLAVGLTPSARIALLCASGGVCGAMMLRALRQGLASSDLAIVRELQRSQPRLGSSLSNALQLPLSGATSATDAELRSQCHSLADRMASGLDLQPMRQQTSRRLTGLLSIAAVCLAVLFGSWPMSRVALQRWAQPLADNPPWSRVSVAVKATPQVVERGGDAMITATISEPVDRPVEVAVYGTHETRIPMQMVDERTYVLSLANLLKPVRFRVHADSAVSAVHELAVVDGAEASTSSPAAGGHDDATTSLEKQVMDRLGELLQEARKLAGQAQQASLGDAAAPLYATAAQLESTHAEAVALQASVATGTPAVTALPPGYASDARSLQQAAVQLADQIGELHSTLAAAQAGGGTGSSAEGQRVAQGSPSPEAMMLMRPLRGHLRATGASPPGGDAAVTEAAAVRVPLRYREQVEAYFNAIARDRLPPGERLR